MVLADHRVLEHYDGDITRVNVHPRVRHKVLARYGTDERSRKEQTGRAA